MACNNNIIRGATGTVKTGAAQNIFGNAKSWSLSISVDTVDGSTFCDNSWKKSIPTQKNASGSVVCLFDPAGLSETDIINSMMVSSVVALELGMGAGTDAFDLYSFDAIITSMDFSVDVAGVVEATFNFEAFGEITIA